MTTHRVASLLLNIIFLDSYSFRIYLNPMDDLESKLEFELNAIELADKSEDSSDDEGQTRIQVRIDIPRTRVRGITHSAFDLCRRGDGFDAWPNPRHS